MKIVLACEGECEVKLIFSLIEKKQLVFENQIFMNEPQKIKQINKLPFKAIINTLPNEEQIVVYRIGDTLTDELSLKGLEARIPYITIYKICTKSEIEILPIINENLYKEYLKTKANVFPKEFAKQNIKNFEFNDYIDSHDMLYCIKEYHRLKKKTHNKDELTLFELIFDKSLPK